MLVGEPPHVGNSAQAIVAKIPSDTPAPIGRTREFVPANVDAAVHCALAKSPADRFSSAADFSAALLNPAFTLPTHPGAAERADAPSAWTWNRATLGMTALTVVMTILALWGWLNPEPPRPVTRRPVAFLSAGSSVLQYRQISSLPTSCHFLEIRGIVSAKCSLSLSVLRCVRAAVVKLVVTC